MRKALLCWNKPAALAENDDPISSPEQNFQVLRRAFATDQIRNQDPTVGRPFAINNAVGTGEAKFAANHLASQRFGLTVDYSHDVRCREPKSQRVTCE